MSVMSLYYLTTSPRAVEFFIIVKNLTFRSPGTLYKENNFQRQLVCLEFPYCYLYRRLEFKIEPERMSDMAMLFKCITIRRDVNL